MKPRVRLAGAYIVKAAESRSSRVEAKDPPPGYRNEPTDNDKALVAALFRAKREDR